MAEASNRGIIYRLKEDEVVLKNEAIKRAKALLRQGYSVREVAQCLGCSRKSVQAIAKRESWHPTRWVFVLVLVLATAGVVRSRKFAQQVPTASATPITLSPMDLNINASYDAIATRAVEDRWLLEKEVFTGPELAHERAVLARLKDELEAALDHYPGIPAVTELKQRFGGRIVPTLFSDFGGGSSKFIQISSEGTDALGKKVQSGIEVVFYPKSHARHPRLKSQHLFYDPQWRACIMAMLDYPDQTWRDAAFIHELWHAKRDRDGAASAHAQPLSDIWVSEELEAHSVQAKVMNLGTRGQYQKLLDVIVHASRTSTSSVQEFLAIVPPVTFGKLDSLFSQPMRGEVEFRTAQYVLNLGVAWLESRSQDGELQARKVALYRSVVRPHTMTVNLGR